MKSKVLHLMFLEEKFTIPLIKYLNSSKKFADHKFLVIGEAYIDLFKGSENVIFLKSPLGRNWFTNYYKLAKNIYSAQKIITHGSSFVFLFYFFPRQIQKIYWMIHGGVDIPHANKAKTFTEKLELFVKRRISYHVTHIEEDSHIVNRILNIQSQFVYSPGYLSNVCANLKSQSQFVFKNNNEGLNILVGNSIDPSNQHVESFQILEDSGIKFKTIYSVLSYGLFEDYKQEVIQEGKNKFKEQFRPITEFMSQDAYLKFLESIDVVLFNHERQEAMGVTIQLLSLGKPIFFNAKSPAYQSLIRRGYKVFDNQEIDLLKDVVSLDLSINRELLKVDYAMNQIDSFYSSL